MILLDENIPENQRQLLRGWRIHVRQIGYEISHKGIQDEAIIPFLLQRSWPTFFTRDLDFYNRQLYHRRYCLACLAVHRQETAVFIQR